MNKLGCILGCLLLLCIGTLSVSGQILSPIAHLEGTFDTDTRSIFIGKTSLIGSFGGIPIEYMESIASTSSVFGIKDLTAFPIFGSAHLQNLDHVSIIDLEQLFGDAIPDDISMDMFTTLNSSTISSYSNVNLVTDLGTFALLSQQGNEDIHSQLDYAISAVISFELSEGNPFPFLITISNSPITITHTGVSSILMQITDGSTIQLLDQTGTILWDEQPGNKLFLIDDPEFSLRYSSAVSLFPLYVQPDQDPITLDVKPAAVEDINIQQLLENINAATQSFGDVDISQVTNTIQEFDEFIEIASNIVNGGMILLDSDDRVFIDGISQTFSGIGFARSETYQVVIQHNPQGYETQIQGEYQLIFLGDHLYTKQAPTADNGIAFPWLIPLIWMIPIVLYFLFKYYLKKKDVNEEVTKKIKPFVLPFHLITILLVFILMDREISFQFGTSAIDILLGQGFSSILLVFLLIEGIMWVLGYLLLAFPLRMTANSLLRFFSLGKETKGIGKGIGLFGIWIFTAIYIKLLLNLVLQIINPFSMIPMG